MERNDIMNLILIILILYVFLRILRVIKFSKVNQRISKYTVKIEKNEKLSIGERLSLIYYKFRIFLVKYLSKLKSVKKASKKYEKYVYTTNDKLLSSVEIIANKIMFSILLSLLYIVFSIYNNSFDFIYLLFYLIVGFYGYNIYLIINDKKRNVLIENDLLKSIIIMNNAFKSGYNISQAINMVTKDLTGPISEEFKKISIDLKYGLELKDVFDRFYERVKVKDARYITSSLSMLNLTGGNLVPIFSSIEKSFTNKKRLKDELNSLTSSSKLVYYFLLFMPGVLSLFLFILNPDYFKPLYNTVFGYVVLSLIIILYVSYIFIIKRIMKVDL